MLAPGAGGQAVEGAWAHPDDALTFAGLRASFWRMPAPVSYPHIVKEDGKSARLERHPRTRVSMIVTDYLWRGWSAEEIVRQYPYLSLAEVHAALTYYHDHEAEIDRELAHEASEVERLRQQTKRSPVVERLRALKSRRAA